MMDTIVYLEKNGLKFELTLTTKDTQTHSRMQQCPNDIHGHIKGFMRHTLDSINGLVAANSNRKD